MARIELITHEQAPLPVRHLFANGDPGALVASLAHTPEVVDVTLRFISRVLGPTSIDARTKEIVILRASVVQQCRFCTETHTCVALDIGLSRDEVVALRGDAPAGRAFSNPAEAALVAWTEAVALGPGPIDGATASSLREHWPDHAVMELTLLAATTVMLARYCTALDLPTREAWVARLAEEGL